MDKAVDFFFSAILDLATVALLDLEEDFKVDLTTFWDFLVDNVGLVDFVGVFTLEFDLELLIAFLVSLVVALFLDLLSNLVDFEFVVLLTGFLTGGLATFFTALFEGFAFAVCFEDDLAIVNLAFKGLTALLLFVFEVLLFLAKGF